MLERTNHDLQKEWERKLAASGLPAEPPSEQEMAAQAGIELTSIDMASPEAQAIEKKLQEEDPTNIFGGFVNNISEILSVIKDLRQDWLKQGTLPEEIRITIHASCENGSDCVVVSHIGGNKYHYNTAHIRKYSRKLLLARLSAENISFAEK